MSRHGRQVRLAEVGAAGQARIEATRVGLATAGFARGVEERYLRAAGVQVDRTASAPELAHLDLGLRHEAAREVGVGAYAALLVLRRAVLDHG